MRWLLGRGPQPDGGQPGEPGGAGPEDQAGEAGEAAGPGQPRERGGWPAAGGGDSGAAGAAGRAAGGGAGRACEADLEAQLGEKDQKLVAASRALSRCKGQVRQLNAQLGLKGIEAARLETQVKQLQVLLAEKERHLQETFDELDGARQAAAPAKPHELLPVPEGGEDDRELLEHLAAVGEELTLALDHASEAEATLQRQCAAANDELIGERELRLERERELAHERAQAEGLRAAMALDRAHMAELRGRAARAEIDDRMRHVFAQRATTGKAPKEWHPHLDI